MALGANSYGDTGEVALLVPRFDNGSGVFDATTRPTLLQMESEMDQLSATLNALLAELGFAIPVSQADSKLMLDGFVNKMAAEIANGVNGAGRFGPTAQSKKGSKGAYMMILEDAQSFLQVNATGMERLGATRTYSATDGLRARDTDESGDETHPWFQREGFGEVWRNDDD